MHATESIQARLRRIILATSAAVLLVAVSTFFVYEIFAFRRSHLEDLSTIAAVVAQNSSGALAFLDEKDAQDALDSLKAEETVQIAVLYDEKGIALVRYPANLPAQSVPNDPGPDRAQYEHGKLVVVRPVYEQRRIGTLLIEADLTPLYARLQVYSLIVALVLATSFLVAYLLSFWLQRRVSDPILELARAAALVTTQRDYSVRAQRRTNDEVGGLTEAFNTMLAEIAKRDQALRESTERLQLSLEASQTGTWDWDIPSGRLTWDAHLLALFGIDPGNFKETYDDFLQRIHPQDRPGVERIIRRAVEKGRDIYAEYRIIWPDGTIRHMTSRGRAFADPSGKPVRMTGVTIDVTESKKAEQALRESEERFRTMADAAPVLIWTVAPDRSRDYFNKAWIQFTGRTLAELLGDGWIEDVHAEDRDRVRKVFSQAFKEHREFEKEFRLRAADGSYHVVRDHGIPRFAPDGTFRGYIGSAIDITDIRHAQSQLERRVEARTAELAEINRELESFTYSVSHDLRAPLRHINAYAQVLEEDYSAQLDEQGRKYLSRIQAGAKNMGALVDDLLNLARVGRQELNIQQCSLDQLLRELVQEIGADAADRQIEWRISDLGTIECDPGLIKQVFVNLLSNAVKYTRPRAVALIEIGRRELEGKTMWFVKDNGVGFDMKYANKLFGVFQRLHRADEFEGTGVGLAIVERIIRRHGGRIWAEAELDKGATFYFTLKPQGETQKDS
jgi:PAS domain S-box-containing protein